MSRKKARSASHQIRQAEIDDQVARLREVLKLMASGSGAMAFGAAHKVPADIGFAAEAHAVKVAR